MVKPVMKELEEIALAEGKIMCWACGKHLKRMTATHTQRIHSMTVAEYKARYPHAITEGAGFIANATKAANDPTTVQMHKDIMNTRYADPEEREKQAEINRRLAKDPERNKAVSEGHKKWWAENKGPGARGNSIELMHSPEARKLKGESMRKCWKDPEYIAQMKERSDRCSMEGHPNWQGGRSFEEYPAEFGRIRPSILVRDNNECQECFMPMTIHKEWWKQELHVHHKDANKLNNDEGNLVTLCIECHMNQSVHRKDPEDNERNSICGNST